MDGLLSEAKQVFDKLQVRDVVIWNMLISGYVEQRQKEKAPERCSFRAFILGP
jgi:hypothetical protein